MKLPLLVILALSIILSACKKDNKEPEEPEHDGSYPGKIKSINGSAWKFRYDEEGKLNEYDYNEFGITKTVVITWEDNQVTVNNGFGFTTTRPFNSAGYVIPNANESQTSWIYDANNHITFLNGSNYYWSNGNIDSLTFGSTRLLIEYSCDLDTRDFGANRIPSLPNFPDYNLNVKNLKSRAIQYDQFGDTVSIKLYTYTFNSNNRIASELVDIVVDGDTNYHSLRNYAYYE